MQEREQGAPRDHKQEVIKHSAAIQIENHMTLLQRRTWNALLYHAYHKLVTQEEHEITLQDLATLVGYHSHDMDYLKDAAVAMLRCIVQYNILGKDGSVERWGATALLAQADIQKPKGLFVYAYSPELRRRLHNPDMYARLDLDLQKQFASKYALALWELCTDYLGAGRASGETPFIEVPIFRKLLGIVEGMYPTFMRLNERVLKPALGEVNRVSDFTVTLGMQRQGRKVVALKFTMHRVACLPELPPIPPSLDPEPEALPVIVQALREAGVSTSDALDLWQQGFACVEPRVRPTDQDAQGETAFAQYVREKVHLLQRRQAAGKIDNPTGFLLQAIRQNYANPAFAQKAQRQIAPHAPQTLRHQDVQRQALVAEKTALEQECERELDRLRAQVAMRAPEVIEHATATLLTNDDGFQFLYERGKSAHDNYQERYAIQAFLNPYLEQHDPVPFEGIRQRYAAQSAAVEAQIAALCP